MRLEGQVAIVTGGAGALGSATCELFASEGAIAIVADTAGDAAESVVAKIRESGGEALALVGDMSKRDDIQRVVDTATENYGRLDILVNLQGNRRPAPLLEMTDDEWQQVVDVHLTGTFICTQVAARAMLGGEGGRIVHCTSPYGLHGGTDRINYCAAKSGVVGFVKSAALELAHHGITVNAISPVAMAAANDWLRQNPALEKAMIDQIPLGRMADPDEVVPAILFLASEDASYVTGQVLSADGGMRAPAV